MLEPQFNRWANHCQWADHGELSLWTVVLYGTSIFNVFHRCSSYVLYSGQKVPVSPDPIFNPSRLAGCREGSLPRVSPVVIVVEAFRASGGVVP